MHIKTPSMIIFIVSQSKNPQGDFISWGMELMKYFSFCMFFKEDDCVQDKGLSIVVWCFSKLFSHVIS